MIWLIGPKLWSNISRHIEPATIGETTAGKTRSATNSRLSGRSTWKCKASSRPSTSSIGSATARMSKRAPERGPDARIGERASRNWRARPSCRYWLEPVRSWKLTTTDQRKRKQPDEQHDEDGRARQRRAPCRAGRPRRAGRSCCAWRRAAVTRDRRTASPPRPCRPRAACRRRSTR